MAYTTCFSSPVQASPSMYIMLRWAFMLCGGRGSILICELDRTGGGGRKDRNFVRGFAGVSCRKICHGWAFAIPFGFLNGHGSFIFYYFGTLIPSMACPHSGGCGTSFSSSCSSVEGTDIGLLSHMPFSPSYHPPTYTSSPRVCTYHLPMCVCLL